MTYVGADPGKGAALHAHLTVEVFVAMSGKWAIIWGANGENEVTLERFDVSPEAVVMVGNSLPADVVGAQGGGIYAVWVNRAGESRGSVRPDAEIASLLELRPLLASGDLGGSMGPNLRLERPPCR